MKLRMQSIISCDVICMDGRIGDVQDLLFEDDQGVIRYIVVDTGNWLPGRKILVSPIAIRTVDVDNRQILVSLDKEQIEDSPGLESDKPVSRQYESRYFGHFQWPRYWNGPHAWGSEPVAFPPSRIEPVSELPREEGADAHLRSFLEVDGYQIICHDGPSGKISDFVFDGRTWKLQFAIADVGNWLISQYILVPFDKIEHFRWSSRQVFFNLEREYLESAPGFDPTVPISVHFQKQLEEYFSKVS